MALKTEVWSSSLQCFAATDIDQTFKRSPGSCFRPAGAEERTLPQRSEKCRPSSCPPLSLEATCFFHHRDPIPQPRGPMLYCKAAVDCGHDKVSLPTKKGLGSFSPQAGATATPRLNSTVVADFHSRGICDIDRNPTRGNLQNSQRTTLQLEQQFSEETETSIKKSLASLSSGTCSEASEVVRELGCLGLECRRLQAASLSHSESQQALRARALPEPLPMPLRTSLATPCKTNESKPVPIPLLMQRSMRQTSTVRQSPNVSKGGHSRFLEDAGFDFSQMQGMNLNTRRLENSYRTQHKKMPERAWTLSRTTLPSAGKSSSCCSTFEGNDDEVVSTRSLISAESGYPNLLEGLKASSLEKDR